MILLFRVLRLLVSARRREAKETEDQHRSGFDFREAVVLRHDARVEGCHLRVLSRWPGRSVRIAQDPADCKERGMKEGGGALSMPPWQSR